MFLQVPMFQLISSLRHSDYKVMSASGMKTLITLSFRNDISFGAIRNSNDHLFAFFAKLFCKRIKGSVASIMVDHCPPDGIDDESPENRIIKFTLFIFLFFYMLLETEDL